MFAVFIFGLMLVTDRFTVRIALREAFLVVVLLQRKEKSDGTTQRQRQLLYASLIGLKRLNVPRRLRIWRTP